MKRIVALDPGTRGLGLVSALSDGVAHTVTDVDVFESVPAAAKYSYAQHDDRVRRTRELHGWLRGKLAPVEVLVVEAMGFPPDQHAVAMMCLAWGVIVSLLEERRIRHEARHPGWGPMELFEVQAARWRTHLVGHALLGKRRPTERVMRQVVNERERHAQTEALRRHREAETFIDRIQSDLRVHALDALGVFDWAVHDLEVRRLLSVGR